MTDDNTYAIGTTLRYVELAEKLRGTEIWMLQALATVRGIDPE